MPIKIPLKIDQHLNPTALRKMPKIDLHRHLEGSLRLETLLEIAQRHGLDLPAADKERLRPYVQITDDPPDHRTFLSKFEVLRHFYRSPEAIHRLAYEVVADAAQDNIHYLELRFSPQALARVRGFPLREVTDWVITATQDASRDLGIQVRLIVTLVRHDPIDQARLVAETAFARFGSGIVGLDLAGDEVRFPAGPYVPFFAEAKRLGMGVTVHAGEWASAEGVRQAIEELNADRIGHGVRCIENSQILRLVRKRHVALEVCLTSNLQTGVVQHITHHPLVDLLNLGVIVTLNTDDPSISNLSLTDEYQVAVESLGLQYADLRKLVFNAAHATFLPDNERQGLLAFFTKQLPEDLLREPPTNMNEGMVVG
jgi:adenosine deaminase